MEGKDALASNTVRGVLLMGANWLAIHFGQKYGLHIDPMSLVSNLLTAAGAVLAIVGTFSPNRAPIHSVAGLVLTTKKSLDAMNKPVPPAGGAQ